MTDWEVECAHSNCIGCPCKCHEGRYTKLYVHRMIRFGMSIGLLFGLITGILVGVFIL